MEVVTDLFSCIGLCIRVKQITWGGKNVLGSWFNTLGADKILAELNKY